MAPQSRFVDLAEARHMVAGDVNDVFSETILAFLAELPKSDKNDL